MQFHNNISNLHGIGMHHAASQKLYLLILEEIMTLKLPGFNMKFSGHAIRFSQNNFLTGTSYQNVLEKEIHYSHYWLSKEKFLVNWSYYTLFHVYINIIVM